MQAQTRGGTARAGRPVRLSGRGTFESRPCFSVMPAYRSRHGRLPTGDLGSPPAPCSGQPCAPGACGPPRPHRPHDGRGAGRPHPASRRRSLLSPPRAPASRPRRPGGNAGARTASGGDLSNGVSRAVAPSRSVAGRELTGRDRDRLVDAPPGDPGLQGSRRLGAGSNPRATAGAVGSSGHRMAHAGPARRCEPAHRLAREGRRSPSLARRAVRHHRLAHSARASRAQEAAAAEDPEEVMISLRPVGGRSFETWKLEVAYGTMSGAAGHRGAHGRRSLRASGWRRPRVPTPRGGSHA